jgi:hypothetical protein
MHLTPDEFNDDLTTREGWQAWALRDEIPRPQRHSKQRLARMSDIERASYARERRRYHAAMAPIKTGPLTHIEHELELQLEANTDTPPGDPRPAMLIDAAPNVGKSTILRDFGRAVERALRDGAAAGEFPVPVAHPHVWVPVVHLTLRADTTLKGVNTQLVRFYGALTPAAAKRRAGVPEELILRGDNKDGFTNVLATLTRCCATQLILVDDVHFLRMGRKTAADVNDHFKNLMSELPVTFVFAGVDCVENGFLTEGLGARQANSQLRWRVTPLQFDPYQLRDDPEHKDADRNAWLGLLAKIEQRLVLAGVGDDEPYLREHAVYLHQRTGGRIGRLMNLVRKAAAQAIRERTERIDQPLLDRITIPSDEPQPTGKDAAAQRRGKRKGRKAA